MSDVSSEPEARGSSEGSTVNALEVLLASASTKTLPDPLRSGKDKTATAMDRLIENVIEHLRARGLGFPTTLSNSEGM